MRIPAPCPGLNMTFWAVNRTLLDVSATIFIFAENSDLRSRNMVEDVLIAARMCGNLAICNQILTQFRGTNVLIRT